MIICSDRFRLLGIEMLNGKAILENHDFRKEVSRVEDKLSRHPDFEAHKFSL